MPGFTYVHYDGTDERILELVSKLVSGNDGNGGGQPTASLAAATSSSSTWDEIARRFAEYINNAAAAGNQSQKNAMLAWLRSDGEIHLVKLWKSAGVKVQHDYSGVGGSMTKNMIKARGPRDWYTAHINGNG